MMLETLRDLFRHEAWANAEQLCAIGAHLAARQDIEILQRFQHIHECQMWYLGMFQGAPCEPSQEPPPSLDQLRDSIRRYHARIAELLAAMTEDQLRTVRRFPHTRTASATLGEAMLQVPMHSQYHRGQVATRLRELGGEPPVTDYVLWVFKARPQPAWGRENEGSPGMRSGPGPGRSRSGNPG